MQSFIMDAVLITLMLSCIPMIAIAIASGAVALVQAATQIQEQSVTHLVRIVTFVVVAFVAGDWSGRQIVYLFERSLQALEAIGKVP